MPRRRERTRIDEGLDLLLAGCMPLPILSDYIMDGGHDDLDGIHSLLVETTLKRLRGHPVYRVLNVIPRDARLHIKETVRLFRMKKFERSQIMVEASTAYQIVLRWNRERYTYDNVTTLGTYVEDVEDFRIMVGCYAEAIQKFSGFIRLRKPGKE